MSYKKVSISILFSWKQRSKVTELRQLFIHLVNINQVPNYCVPSTIFENLYEWKLF